MAGLMASYPIWLEPGWVGCEPGVAKGSIEKETLSDAAIAAKSPAG